MPPNAPYARALMLLSTAKNWQAFRSRLDREGLRAELDSQSLMALADAFQARTASQMNDAQLLAELCFWADGGHYNDHLDGHEAVAPRLLVSECQKRGWNVRDGLSIGAVISPPEGGLLTIPKAVLIG